MKVPGVVQNPADILALPVKKSGDRIVTIGDIGDVRRTFKEPDFITRFNGQPAVALEVTKRNGANLLDTVTSIRRVVAEEQKHWPSTVQVGFTYDTSRSIARTLTVLESGIISASLLVLMIVVASLGIRQGIIVGLAIPTCFLIAFLLIHADGVTLNKMVMYGMVLAVGILVDGGIVVVEYADRKMAEGMPKEQAFAAAAKRMFWPVVNGTLTTLCAVPAVHVLELDRGSKFASFLPLTLFFDLGASIFVAPFDRSRRPWVRFSAAPPCVDAAHLAEIEKSEHGDPREMAGFMGRYAKTISMLGRHPGRTALATLLIIVGIGFWFSHTRHRTELFLDQDPEQVTIYVKARGNLSPDAQDTLLKQVEARLVDVKGVESMYVRAGGISSNGGPTSPPNDTVGLIQVEFQQYETRKVLGVRGKDISNAIRARVTDLPGVQIEVREPEGGTPVGKGVQVMLTSHDPAVLDRAADRVKARLASDPQLIELEDNRTSPGIEYNLTVRPRRRRPLRRRRPVSGPGDRIHDGRGAGGPVPSRRRPGRVGYPRVRFHDRRPHGGGLRPADDQHAPGPGPGELLRQARARPTGHPDSAARGPADGAGADPGQHDQGRRRQPEGGPDPGTGWARPTSIPKCT